MLFHHPALGLNVQLLSRCERLNEIPDQGSACLSVDLQCTVTLAMQAEDCLVQYIAGTSLSWGSTVEIKRFTNVLKFRFFQIGKSRTIIISVTWLFEDTSSSFFTTGFDRSDRISRASISFGEKKMVMIVIQPAFTFFYAFFFYLTGATSNAASFPGLSCRPGNVVASKRLPAR